MLFNSFLFAIFFPVVTLGYFWLPRSARNGWLLVASCLFYAAYVPSYLLILFFTIAVDYLAGRAMERAGERWRRWWLAGSIVANVGMLALFKYLGPSRHWLLPIGLSFHTFQAMSYTIEVYRRKQRAERNLLRYALYVMFYPQLVAGPIERPQNLLPQLKAVPEPTESDVSAGCRLMLWGFFQKIFVADRLAVAVNHLYSRSDLTHGFAAWIAVCFFAIEVYCDFCGYSDIARGAARVMGFRLMQNFDRPFFSASLGEFWRRWHISLSSWFRDYVYIPLGGNRVSSVRRALNLFVVFLLSGAWHGASWTFVAWGAVSGVAMAVTSWLPDLRLPRAARVFLTFQFFALSLILFRAPSFAIAMRVFRALFDWRDGLTLTTLGLSSFELLCAFAGIAVLFAGDALRDRVRFASWPMWLRWLSYYGATGAIVSMGSFSARPFIYFQF